MINPVLFWVIAAGTVIPATALLFVRRGVHIAVSIITVMVGLAAAFVALEAPFLGIVQIVVYTGAVMMLFLFVLMLIGVDKRESLKETIKGQRWIAFFGVGGLAIVLISVVRHTSIALQRPDNPLVGNPEEIAGLLFGRYVLVMEVLGFLLITAAVGALVLTHTPRLLPKRTQREISIARVKSGADPVNKPMPGVYARHNALDVPALDPEGKPIQASLSRVLEARGQNRDGSDFLPPAVEDGAAPVEDEQPKEDS